MAYNVWETCLLVPGLSRGECASWVQAVGTIVAIGVVFVADGLAERMRRRNAADDEQSRRKFAAQLTADVHAFVAARVVHQARKAREDQKPYVYDLASFDAYVRVLQGALRPSEIPAAMVPSLVYSLRSLLRFRHAAERANAGDPIDEPQFGQAIGGAKQALDAAAREAGVPPNDLLLRSELAPEEYVERQRQKREARS